MVMSAAELVQGEVWLGADVSKNTFDVGLLMPEHVLNSTEFRNIPVQTFPRTAAGAAACIDWARKRVGEVAGMRLVMEATGAYSSELAQWLSAQCPSLAPAIVNPARTKSFIDSLGLRTKTDRSDARALALYGAQRRPAGYEAPTAERAQLRALSRYRDVLVQEKVAVENRGEHENENALVRKLQKQRLKQLETHLAKVEAEMKAVIKRSPALTLDYDLLVSIAGVAFITASMILAEVGDLRRFTRGRQLAAFIGLSPRHHESGTSIHGKPRLCKQGNARVRAGLYMAAMTAARQGGKLQADYLRLLASGKAPKSAMGAIMRKLLILMRAVVVSGVPYDPSGKPKAPEAVDNFVDNLGITAEEGTPNAA